MDQPIRRMKTYTAQTGYVYQYYFVGRRQAFPEEPEAPALEYVFDVTSDRGRATYAISIFLQQQALANWAAAHGRSLTDAEQYAGAKLRLLQGLDEIEDISASERRLLISADNLDEVLEALNLE